MAIDCNLPTSAALLLWASIVATAVSAFFQYVFITIGISPFVWFYPPILFGLAIFGGVFLIGRILFRTRALFFLTMALLIGLYPLYKMKAPLLFAVGIPGFSLIYAIALLANSRTIAVLRPIYSAFLCSFIATLLLAPYLVMLYVVSASGPTFKMVADLHPMPVHFGLAITTLLIPSALLLSDYLCTTSRSSSLRP